MLFGKGGRGLEVQAPIRRHFQCLHKKEGPELNTCEGVKMWTNFRALWCLINKLGDHLKMRDDVKEKLISCGNTMSGLLTF